MKTKSLPIRLCALLASLFALVAPPASSADEALNDHTLSPYFYVKSGAETNSDTLPLKESNVEVKIAGVIADVRVSQTYSNAGGQPLEAIYIFPGSTRAAVYGMEMTIGERKLKAQIQKRQEARQTYEKAKSEGRATSLLEQQRPNVFQMNVANILPGETVQVELRYTELLVPTAGEYEFVFPTVVGPRYSNQSAEGAPAQDKFVQNPYLAKGVRSSAGFHLALDLVSPLPIKEALCTSHQAEPQFRDASQVHVEIPGSSEPANDRDFIFKYRLSGTHIDSGLILGEGEKGNFFLLTVQPPKRVTPAELPAREYIFVIDVSGSMEGFPLDTAKKLVSNLLENLRPQDRFDVLLFSGAGELLSPEPMPASKQNINFALQAIARHRGGGGTELLPALRQSLSVPRSGEVSRSIVVITDGFISAETEMFDYVAKHLSQANLFAFGIGSSVNRHLIEGLAHVGQGEPFIVTNPAEAPAKAAQFREYISAPVLTNIDVKFDGFAAVEVEPQQAPDLLAERPLVIFGKYHGQPGGTIRVRGRSGAGEFAKDIPVEQARRIGSSDTLGYLWARARIAKLGDYEKLQSTDERVQAITNLGLTYNLLTAHTSFVAVDTEARPNAGKPVLGMQPSPLPKGVENNAVGGPGSSVPEPGSLLLFLTLGPVLGMKRLRSRAAVCKR